MYILRKSGLILKKYYGDLLDVMDNILENLQTQELFQSSGNHNYQDSNHFQSDHHQYFDN